MDHLVDGDVKIPSPKKYLMELLAKRVDAGNKVPAHEGPWEKVRSGDITYDIDMSDGLEHTILVIKAKPCKATVIDIEQLLYQFLVTLGFRKYADDMWDSPGIGVISGLEDGTVMCHQYLSFDYEEAQ